MDGTGSESGHSVGSQDSRTTCTATEYSYTSGGTAVPSSDVSEAVGDSADDGVVEQGEATADDLIFRPPPTP